MSIGRWTNTSYRKSCRTKMFLMNFKFGIPIVTMAILLLSTLVKATPTKKEVEEYKKEIQTLYADVATQERNKNNVRGVRVVMSMVTVCKAIKNTKTVAEEFTSLKNKQGATEWQKAAIEYANYALKIGIADHHLGYLEAQHKAYEEAKNKPGKEYVENLIDNIKKGIATEAEDRDKENFEEAEEGRKSLEHYIDGDADLDLLNAITMVSAYKKMTQASQSEGIKELKGKKELWENALGYFIETLLYPKKKVGVFSKFNKYLEEINGKKKEANDKIKKRYERQEKLIEALEKELHEEMEEKKGNKESGKNSDPFD